MPYSPQMREGRVDALSHRLASRQWRDAVFAATGHLNWASHPCQISQQVAARQEARRLAVSVRVDLSHHTLHKPELLRAGVWRHHRDDEGEVADAHEGQRIQSG